MTDEEHEISDMMFCVKLRQEMIDIIDSKADDVVWMFVTKRYLEEFAANTGL